MTSKPMHSLIIALTLCLLPLAARAGLVEGAEQVIQMEQIRLAQATLPGEKVIHDPMPADAPDPAPALTPAPKADSAGLGPKTGLAPEAQAKMSADQLFALEKERLANEARRDEQRDPVPAVAIVAPVATFIMIVLIVLLVLFYRARKDRQIHETLRLMVEKGAPIPTELLSPGPRAQVDLRRGVLLLALGVGYMLFMCMVAIFEPDAWRGVGVGLIPIFLGIGYLLVWKLGKRDDSRS